MDNREFECVKCGHVWQVAPCAEGGGHGYEIPCPKCGSLEKMKIQDGVKNACGGAAAHDKSGGCCCGH